MRFSGPNRQALFLASVAALVLMAGAPANATIISVSPTGGSVGDNVISANCADGANGPALTITGCLNHDHTSAGDVDFRSNENIQFDAGGQAVVRGTDGDLQTLTIDPVSFTLGELIVNINANADGWVQFCDNNGCWGTTFALSKSGSNFFDINFNPKADFLTINTFSSSTPSLANQAQLISDSKQWRVSTLPEPFTLSLFGAGIAGAAALRRRKKAQPA